jgi:hypothetical protein
MPIGPHRGDNLTYLQLRENRDTVHNAWKKGYDHIRHSLFVTQKPKVHKPKNQKYIKNNR